MLGQREKKTDTQDSGKYVAAKIYKYWSLVVSVCGETEGMPMRRKDKENV